MQRGLVRMFVLPLIFGERTVGCISLSFRHRQPISPQQSELLVALGHQATLAIELTRHARTAQETAVLMERNRISQEIHDGLAQAFTGILMQLGAAESFRGCSGTSPLADILGRIRALAKEGLAEARRSVVALQPEQVREGQLAKALAQLAERSTVSGRVQCTFEGISNAPGLPPEHKHELLRIAQEAVSNAVRHAQPNKVLISMTEQAAHWELAVADDGIGMQAQPEERYADQGFGLMNMRDRTRAIGGEWSLESGPGLGTRISVRLPKRGVAA
jgi:signal transduction histidine kinase